MFFEQENIGFIVLDVMELHQETARSFNCNRKYNALSFRYESDTVIETKNSVFHLGDNAISYFPPNTDYIRTAKLDHVIVVHFLCFGQESRQIEYFYPDDPEKYKQKFRKLLNVWDKKDVGYKMKAASVLCDIFSDIYSENRPPITKNLLINESVEFAIKNFSDPSLTVETLADISHMSETYFRKLFREEYGISPKKYIINLRINYAKELISMGYYTLPEVSELAGFNDCRHFSVTFKKLTGRSPSEYRHSYISKKW